MKSNNTFIKINQNDAKLWQLCVILGGLNYHQTVDFVFEKLQTEILIACLQMKVGSVEINVVVGTKGVCF